MTALTTNDRRVIIERGRGWEKARPALLADVFGVSRQQIVSILKDACATCGEYLCDHTDAEWEVASTGRNGGGVARSIDRATDGRVAADPFAGTPSAPNQSRVAACAEPHRASARA